MRLAKDDDALNEWAKQFLPDVLHVNGWMAFAKRDGRWKRCTVNAAGMEHIIFETKEHAMEPVRQARAQGFEAVAVPVSGKLDVLDDPDGDC